MEKEVVDRFSTSFFSQKIFLVFKLSSKKQTRNFNEEKCKSYIH